jgi:hypothetical protein
MYYYKRNSNNAFPISNPKNRNICRRKGVLHLMLLNRDCHIMRNDKQSAIKQCLVAELYFIPMQYIGVTI